MSDDVPQTVNDGAETHYYIDQDKFSQTIQSFPIIWDSSHSEFKNKQLKNATWDKISKIMDTHDKTILKRKYTNRRDLCLKRYNIWQQNILLKKGKPPSDSPWNFLFEDFEHKKQHTVKSDGKDFVGEIFANERQNESTETSTGKDILEPDFAFENVKRRKRDVESKHGSRRCHVPQTTEEDEEMKDDYDDSDYDDQSDDNPQTGFEKSTIKKFGTFYTENAEEEQPYEHSRSWKQCRTELKNQHRNFLSGSAPRTFFGTDFQQQKTADKTPVVLETAASSDAIIDHDEETKMNEELREKYLYRKPSKSISGQKTSPNPQKANKEKFSYTKTNAKQSRTAKDSTHRLKRRVVKVEDNNNINESRIIDLTNEDTIAFKNYSEYEENNEGTFRKDGNSDWDSNQSLDGVEDANMSFNDNLEIIIKVENSVDQNDEDEYERNLLEPDENENIGDNVNHPEDRFDRLEYEEEAVVHVTKEESGNSSQNSHGLDTYLPVRASEGNNNVQSPEKREESMPMSVEHHRQSTSKMSLMEGGTSKLPLAPSLTLTNSAVNECSFNHTQDVVGVPLEENNISNFQSFVKNSLDQHIKNFDAQQLLDFKIGVLEVVRKFLNK